MATGKTASSGLESQKYYRDDSNGIYYIGTDAINIVSYPLRPTLNGTWVHIDDPRYPGMVAALRTKGKLIPDAEAEAQAKAAATNTPVPAPTATYQPSPQSYSPPAASPSPGLPSSPASGPASGGATTPIYLESWFPWVVGGAVVTVAAGLAIVFWPTADSAKSEEDENED